jgi:hypothetical protein
MYQYVANINNVVIVGKDHYYTYERCLFEMISYLADYGHLDVLNNQFRTNLEGAQHDSQDISYMSKNRRTNPFERYFENFDFRHFNTQHEHGWMLEFIRLSKLYYYDSYSYGLKESLLHSPRLEEFANVIIHYLEPPKSNDWPPTKGLSYSINKI